MYEEMYGVALKQSVDIVFCNYATENEDGTSQHKASPYLPANCVIENSQMREYVCAEKASSILWFAVKAIFSHKLLENYGIAFLKGKIVEDTPFNLEAILRA